jgi:inner membrane protease ATP23
MYSAEKILEATSGVPQAPITEEKPTKAISNEKQHEKCQNTVRKIVETSSLLDILITDMGRSGCYVDRSEFFTCRPCDKQVEGFYDKNLGIVICENNVQANSKKLQQILLHESVHAFDYCSANFNFNDCMHVACSEIRSNNLSGECNFGQELRRGNGKWFKQKQRCIKRRATLSLKEVPHCSETAQSSVERAFRYCYKDHQPFGVVPHNIRA